MNLLAGNVASKPSLRCLLAISLCAILVATEVAATYHWQQRSERHVISLALVLGAILGPSIYFAILVVYKSSLPHLCAGKSCLPHFCTGKSCLPHLCIVAGLALVGVVGVVLLMSATSAWCCVREGRRLELCDLAAAAAKVFNQNGLDYHVTFGTLLGVVRSQQGEEEEEEKEKGEEEEKKAPEKKKKKKKGDQIPWEHDIDIAIAEKQAKVAYKLLKDRGFNVERRSSSVVAFRIQLPGANHWASAWAMNWIDVYTFVVEKQTGEIVCNNKKDFFRRPLISDVKPYRNISFCGFDSFAAPRYPLRYVKKQYGRDWRTPIFPDNYKNNTCALFQDC